MFWGADPKTDHESINSTLRVDSSDEIQIGIFKIHNLSVFFGKGFEKNIFLNKNGTQRMPYKYQMYDILAELLLSVVAPSELLVTYHLMFFIGLDTNIRILFKIFRRFFEIFRKSHDI